MFLPALLALALLAVGVFLPVTADATVSTYYWQIDSGTTLGGVTTNWTETCGTYATSGGPYWITTMSTTAPSCASHRIYNGLDATSAPLDMLLMVKPTPFASATVVTGQSTGSAWTLRYAVTFRMILGYVDGAGFHGMGSVDQTATATTTTYNPDLSAIGFTAPAGSYFAVKIQKVNTGTTTGRIYLDNVTTSAARGIRVAVDETVATGDTTPPVDGATFTATPVSPTQIDLDWSPATDNVALHPTTPYKLVRATGATPPADCSGTAIFYGNDLAFSDTGRTALTQYSYRVCAYDTSFNVSAGKTASATTLDNTPPTAGSVNVSPLVSTYTTGAPAISAAFTDNQTAVTSCEYTVNGGANWLAGSLSGSAPTWTCTANPTGLSGTLAINMRATSQGGTTTATEVTASVDNTAPATTASATGYTFGDWTGTSPVSVTLSSTDLQSGVAANNPKYCTDTTNTCTPTTTYSTALSLTCASGSNCTQYIRTQATDTLNNVSSVGSHQVRQDRQVPTDGSTFTAVPNSATQINLAWSAASDSGSGLNTAAAYKVVKASGATAPADCSTGTVVYAGGLTSTADSGLAPGSQWSYRVCAYDAVGNVSPGKTATATTTAGCIRSAPTVTIIESDKTITSPGGLVSYTVRVMNNDNASCSATTFNLSATNTNGTDFSVSIPATLDNISPGAYADAVMVVSHVSASTTASTVNTARASSASHSQVTSNAVTTNITLQWQIQKCSDCHGYPPKDAVDGDDPDTLPERDNPKGAVFGAHAAHVIATDNAPAPAGKLDCTDCHEQTWTDLNDFSHADGFINMAPVINGGAYVPGNGRTNPMPQRPDLTAADMGTCVNTACHADASPLWYDPAAYTVACDSCHGQPPSGSIFPDLNGSHQAHWNQTVEGGQPINACSRCHDNTPGLGNLWLPPHLNGSADQNCNSATCHNTGLVAAGSNPNPTWGVGNADCGWCHGNPPTAPLSVAADHTGVPGTTGCDNCHTHSGTGSPATHINGSIELGTMSCTKCHGNPPNGTTAPNRNNSHTAHYGTTLTTAVSWDCTTANCHVKPASDDYKHANGTTQQACSTAQCHNNTLVITAEALGSAPNPTWGVTPAGNKCGWCHGNPPVNSTKYNHGVVSGSCAECHGHNGSGSTHLNGTLDTASMNCWTCHGDQVSKAYPPRAVNGADGIGAHVKHMEGTAAMTSPAVTCSDCHSVPAQWKDGHYQTGYPADVYMANSTKAKMNGSNPSFTPELNPANGVGGTCSNVYCHGGKMPGGSNNGADITPSWTASSTGCNFCHGTPPNSGTHSGNEVFPGDCAGCHPDTMDISGNIINPANHINGVAQGRCDGCHQYPPTSNAHTTHVNVIVAELGLAGVPAGYVNNPVCGVCHNATSNEWHPGAVVTNGNLRNIFLPDAGANPQQAVYQFGAYPPAYDAGSKTCSNVSCHLGDSMAWGDVAANSCDNCHAQNGRDHHGAGENAALHGLVGAPSGHAVFLFAQGCSDCHPHDGLGSAGSSGHINGIVEFGGARMPSETNPSYTGDYGLNTSCANLCHNNPGGNRWSAGTLTGCEDCHAASGKLLYVSSGFSGWPPVSAKHAKHDANTAYLPNSCNQCHGDLASVAQHVGHRDGHLDTYVDYNPAAKTCNTNTCHYANKPYQPGVYDGDWSTNGTLACNECHGAAGRTLNQGNYPPTSAKHEEHRNASSTYMTSQVCDPCHQTGSTTGTHAGHKNGIKDTPLAYDPNTFSCAANTCHVGNRANLWTTGATLNCEDCHASGKSLQTTLGLSGWMPSSGTHTLHINANPAYIPTDCDSCHGSGYSSFSGAASDPSTHINGTLNNVVSYVPATQTCTNSCHVADQTNSWTAGVLNCQNCHSNGYIGGGSKLPTSGLHNVSAPGVQKHDSTLGVGCTACHQDYSTRPASHLDGVFVADNASNTDRFLLSSVGYVEGVPNAGTCSGPGLLSCHSDKGAWARQWSTAADSTATTAGDPRCNVCHGQAGNWRTGISPSHNKNGINDTAAHNQCGVCHVMGAAPYVWGTNHENGMIEFNNNSEIAYSTANGNCNSSCHSNDAPHTLGVSPNFVNTNGLAGTPPPNCNYCHGYPPNPGYVTPPGSDGFAYLDAPVNEGKGAHTVHVNKLSSLSGYAVDPALARADKYGLGRNAMLCGTCHSNTNHALNSRVIDFNGTTSYRFATSPSSQTYDGTAGVSSAIDFKSCSNLNCHYGTSPGWQDPAKAGQ